MCSQKCSSNCNFLSHCTLLKTFFQNSVQPSVFFSISFPWQKGSEIAWNSKTDFSLHWCSKLSLGFYTTSTLMASETWQIAARKDDWHPRSSLFLQLNRPAIIAINPPKRSRVMQEENCLHLFKLLSVLLQMMRALEEKNLYPLQTQKTWNQFPECDTQAVARLINSIQFNIASSISGLHGILSGKYSAVTTNWHFQNYSS